MTIDESLGEAEAEALRVWLVEHHQALGLEPTSAPEGLLELWTLVRELIVSRAHVAEVEATIFARYPE